MLIVWLGDPNRIETSLDDVVAEFLGQTDDAGTFATTLADFAAAFSGQVDDVGTFSTTLADVSASFSGAVDSPGAFASTLSNVVLAATGDVSGSIIDGTFAATLDPSVAAFAGAVVAEAPPAPKFIGGILGGRAIISIKKKSKAEKEKEEEELRRRESMARLRAEVKPPRRKRRDGPLVRPRDVVIESTPGEILHPTTFDRMPVPAPRVEPEPKPRPTPRAAPSPAPKTRPAKKKYDPGLSDEGEIKELMEVLDAVDRGRSRVWRVVSASRSA